MSHENSVAAKWLVKQVVTGQASIVGKLLTISKDEANWEDNLLDKLLLQSAQDGRDGMVREILHLHKVKADVKDGD